MKAKRQKKAQVYVAVVCKGPEVLRSERPEGDWAAFVGPVRDQVVGRAKDAVSKWGCANETGVRSTNVSRSGGNHEAISINDPQSWVRSGGCSGNYRILLGTLNQEAVLMHRVASLKLKRPKR